MRRTTTPKRKEHITIWLEREQLDYLDELVDRGAFENRSQAIRHAVRSFIKMEKGLVKIIGGSI
jgi:Arc/MetJ-type ribon-helix-helix transcriptional regulator